MTLHLPPSITPFVAKVSLPCCCRSFIPCGKVETLVRQHDRYRYSLDEPDKPPSPDDSSVAQDVPDHADTQQVPVCYDIMSAGLSSRPLPNAAVPSSLPFITASHYIEPQTLTPIAINPTNAGENALPSPGDVSAPPSPQRCPCRVPSPSWLAPRALRHPPRAVTSMVEVFTGCFGDPLNAPSCWVVHIVVHKRTSISVL